MAPPPPAAAGEAEDFLEVRCAGCGETLEVERGLAEFACPDCATPQALPPELMPPPPPRRRRALPLPPSAPEAPAPAGARLPCGSCGAMLGVPPGLARCGCPVCGAELAVDPARLRRYLLSAAAAPLVPVSLPPVFRALEGRQDYPDSTVGVGHIQGHPNNQLRHLERSQAIRQNTQAFVEFPDAGTDSDDIDTEMSNEINEMPCHRNGFPAADRSVGAKGRQLETLNHVTCQAHAQQSHHSVHAEHPSDHIIHVREAQNESASHAMHRGLGHVELVKEKTVVRHTNQVTGTATGPKSVSVQKRQAQTPKQITRDRQQKTRPPKLLSPTEHDPEHSNDNIQVEQDEADMGQVTARLAHKSTKRDLTSSNKGFGHRRSKRLAKQSAATAYYESPTNESEENEAVSPSHTISDSQDIDGVSNDISSSSLPQHNMPHRRSNEADDLHATTQSASIPDMSDPESFACYYSKTCPPEVRRALERNPNFGHAGGKEKRKRGGRGPTLCLKVWTMPEGVRIRVPFNDLGQPIGDEAGTLSSFLGQIARDGTVAPLTYTDWRYFPEKNKKAIMHLVNLKFVLPPIGQIWSMNALGKKWKDWKVVLKHERYDFHETDEERLANRDFRVPEEQWKLLVAYWGTEKAKAASARCKASQEEHPRDRHHRTGSKSYARIREEERQKRPNMVEPSLTDVSILTHTPKDGGSAEVIGPDQ
ncbi:hypothetical protein PAHAL_2G081600 [Panicum hallii]|uniref:Uncharacterized protein n=2 Tax=Panicum hallii TaxID=206008 RepID=A0A2T8KNA5_9POAL|nr:uncharacterized protein LOC112882904 [Panicum hallii]PVH63668.1 hypothetical protein PAHAL_2G081600 [Panicum hallii]